MKALVNIDEDDLALAAALLGTSGRRDTIAAALRVVADRQRLMARAHQDSLALGVGSDITDPIVMARARR
ncbi:DUF2191 domain-containing protein [Luedemannella helvata]|uniref:DUF2191 domain-containing protein n=1 Tax=Luedemannella helvata TaxID=349315 RepID=A0ABN2K1M5_9ACTN